MIMIIQEEKILWWKLKAGEHDKMDNEDNKNVMKADYMMEKDKNQVVM